jgi:hypothetical protein
MRRPNRIALVLAWIILGLASCSGSPQGEPPLAKLSVNPSSITLTAGSTTTFTAVFSASPPEGGSLTWAVTPANGGTITSGGVYTASGTAGHHTIVATWTPGNRALSSSFSGSATVEVLPVPQIDAALNSELVQASGAIQVYGTIQNAAIVGQPVPSVISADPNGDIRVRSSFTPPLPCAGSNTICLQQDTWTTP